jgi:hypothetical protein
MQRREDIRNCTEAVIGFGLFTTQCDTCQEKGILRNYSSNGMIIEAEKSYPKGSVLLVRVLKIEQPLLPSVAQEGFRSICLAEVTWLQDLNDTGGARYRIGLRYLR